MHADTKKPAQPRRRWFRFSLRTLFILVTVLSVPLGWVGWELNQVRKERHAIAWVEEMGGEVSLHSRYRASERSWWEKTTEKWFGKRIRSVSLVKTQVSDLLLLTVLIYLSNLEWTIEEISEEDETHQWAIIRTRNEPLERDYKYFVDF